MSRAAKSLTGDPLTDALVPVAQRLAGALEDADADAAVAAFNDAETIIGDPLVAARALAVVAAAMVPTDQEPSRLLGWWQYREEYARLIAAGVNVGMAQQLSGMKRDLPDTLAFGHDNRQNGSL